MAKKKKSTKKKKSVQSATKTVIDERRAFVGRLMSRGLTVRDIYAALKKSAMENDDSPKCITTKDGTPWSVATIGTDCVAIKKEWLDGMGVPLEEQRAEVLAETIEVIRLAFNANEYKTALAGIRAKRELVGMDAPKRTEEFDKSEDNLAVLPSIPAEMLSPSMLNVYRDVRLRNNFDYIIKGGRGGTKSSTVAELVIYLIINNPDYHALIVRERLNTLRDSAYAEIEWAAGKLGVGDLFRFRKSPLMITYKPTEQNIYFRGANDPLKIRGIKPKFGKIAILWIEEAHMLGGETVIRDVIQSGLRGEEDLKSGSHDISISFTSYNPPPSETNWINRWVEEQKGKEGVFIHHSTYLDVPKEWLGRRFLNEADHLKEKNEKAYRHEYLGEVTGLGGMVFENIELREITDEEISQFDNIKHGVDWGYFPHPFAYGKMHYDVNHEIIYIFNEYYGYKHSNEETFEEIQKHGYNDTRDLIIADSAESKSVARYRYLGANVRGAEKGAGSVRAGVQWLQTRRKIVIDKERAPLHAKQFLYYELDMDKNGDFIEVFPDKNDDTIDVVRYALNLEWRRSDR